MSIEPRMNFEVYGATTVARTYMVVSTSADVDRSSPSQGSGFGRVSARGKLAAEIIAAFDASGGQPVPVTLKIHGYNTARRSFEKEILADGVSERAAPDAAGPGATGPGAETLRPADRFLIGYRWPSEGMLSRESLWDTWFALLLTPSIGIVLLLLPLLRLLSSGGVEALLRPSSRHLADGAHSLAVLLQAVQTPIFAWLQSHAPWAARVVDLLLSPFNGPTAGAIWLGAGLFVLALRLSTYPRDRYRALHYGVPDLGEFIRELERPLHRAGARVRLDVVGHSMGTLLLINAFRVMSDYFHGHKRTDADAPEVFNLLGRDGTFELGTLILCAPDIPAVMATPDHNNYFMSVLRRFDAVHVFCSDRDIILKWLSALANWASEPRFGMAGRKLGNVLLVKAKAPPRGQHDSRNDWLLWPVTRPIVQSQQLYLTDPLSESAPAFVHFHDCTLDASVSGSGPVLALFSLVLVGLLAALSLVTLTALLQWLALMLGITLSLGLLARTLWPRVRDRGLLGGLVGMMAEWPAVIVFVTFWYGWNPHSGYFMFGRPPRQRISALLRNPTLFPKLDPGGQPIEELDEAIRYRFVRVSAGDRSGQ